MAYSVVRTVSYILHESPTVTADSYQVTLRVIHKSQCSNCRHQLLICVLCGLCHCQNAVKMNVKGKLKFTGPNIQSTELGGVTL